MTKKDRFKDRDVEIDFQANCSRQSLSERDAYTFVLLTSGSLKGKLNDISFILKAPTLMCLNNEDKIEINTDNHAVLSKISIEPNFLSTLRVSEKKYIPTKVLQIKKGMELFNRKEGFNGLYHLPTQINSQVLNNFLIASAEIQIQTDSFWVCRIKKSLIEIIIMVHDWYKKTMKEPLQVAIQYISANYHRKITQDDLVRVSHINRVSLNTLFKKNYDCTSMQYLKQYRLKIACQLLALTGLSITEIAYSVGYNFDTFFIKQFEKEKGKTPTQYRLEKRKVAANQ